MYLLVTVGDAEPLIYNLSLSEITIGSSPLANVVLAEKDISKKHLKLISIDGKWTIADQGSTNGTFLEDKQLVPGKKTEFVEGLEVRLGTATYLSLVAVAPAGKIHELKIAAAEEVGRIDQDKTTRISIEQLKAAEMEAAAKKKAQQLALKRREAAEKAKADKARMKRTLIILGIILGVGIGLNKYWNKKRLAEQKKQTNIIKKMKDKAARQEKALEIQD